MHIPYSHTNIISKEAVNTVIHTTLLNNTNMAWGPTNFQQKWCPYLINMMSYPQHFCAPVIHPETGKTIIQYKTFMKDAITCKTWTTAFGKELSKFAQGDNKTGTKGTNSLFGITARGNVIDYPRESTTRTADLTTAKILWNSVLSIKNAKFMCINIKSIYLGTLLDCFQYMKIPLALFPEHIIHQYDLTKHLLNTFVYVETQKAPTWAFWQTNNCEKNLNL